MFDLGRIVDAVSSIAGGAGNTGNSLQQQLAELGIDAASLQGLDAGQIVELLAQHGIDPISMDLGEITGLIDQLGGSEQLTTSIADWLSSRIGRS
jgi:hypothetical protein